jgi:hypothetical protein
MRTLRHWGTLILLILTLAGLFWIAYAITQTQNEMRDSDFFSLWAAGRLLGSGKNPYNEVEWLNIHRAEGAAWVSDPTFLYPLPLAMLFIPLGFLSLQQASILWLSLSQIMIILSVYLCSRMVDWDRWKSYFLPLLLSAALFRAVILTIRNGQLGAFLLLCVSLGFYCWSHKQPLLSGFFLGFLFLKPPITGLFLAVLILWFIIRKSWKTLVGMVVTIGSLITISTLIQPSWMMEWLLIGQGKALLTGGTTPTLWGLTAVVIHQPVLWFWISLSLSFILMGIGFIFLLRAKPKRETMYLTAILLPLSLFTTPYLWAYDQILLLIPMVTIVAMLDELRIPFVMNSSLLLFFDIFVLLLLLLAPTIGNDRLSAIVPLLIIGISAGLFIIQSGWVERRKSMTEPV